MLHSTPQNRDESHDATNEICGRLMASTIEFFASHPEHNLSQKHRVILSIASYVRVISLLLAVHYGDDTEEIEDEIRDHVGRSLSLNLKHILEELDGRYANESTDNSSPERGAV